MKKQSIFVILFVIIFILMLSTITLAADYNYMLINEVSNTQIIETNNVEGNSINNPQNIVNQEEQTNDLANSTLATDTNTLNENVTTDKTEDSIRNSLQELSSTPPIKNGKTAIVIIIIVITVAVILILVSWWYATNY